MRMLTSLNAWYSPDLSKILASDGDFLILGDLYAHHPGWHSSLNDERGDSISEQIDNSNFFILNKDTATRFPPNGNTSSPDVSLISAHLALSVCWLTDVALNSDHLPISITYVDDDQPLPRTAKTYVNFKRAKWGLWAFGNRTTICSTIMPCILC
jgi:hypothetical protein